MHIATGRPIGPIVVVNGSNDASLWTSCPFYEEEEKYFSYFLPQKCEKVHYALWEFEQL